MATIVRGLLDVLAAMAAAAAVVYAFRRLSLPWPDEPEWRCYDLAVFATMALPSLLAAFAAWLWLRWAVLGGQPAANGFRRSLAAGVLIFAGGAFGFCGNAMICICTTRHHAGASLEWRALLFVAVVAGLFLALAGAGSQWLRDRPSDR